MGNMKALVFKRYGRPDQVAFADIPRPAPKPDEILVQVHAAGLNPIDNMIPKGTFKPILRFQLPATLGSDLAGVVVEVGSRVTRFKPGDAVFASIFDLGTGALAEFARRAGERRRAQTGKSGLRASGLDPDGRTDVVASAQGACTPQARPKGVHSRRLRRHRHVRDPVREIPRSKGGYDDQHGKRGSGAEPRGR